MGENCCCSVTQSCPTLCDPIDRNSSTPGFPVLHVGKMDTCICMAESLHCSPETVTIFFVNWLYELSHFSSYPTLCNLMDHTPPGSSVHGILQTRILEWVAISSSRGSSQGPGIKSASLISPALAGGFFTSIALYLYFDL